MIDPPNLGASPQPPPGFALIEPEKATEWPADWGQAKSMIDALPENKRDLARKEWAHSIVANERKNGGLGQVVDDTVRRLARGIPVVGGFADEGNAKIASMLGYDYDMQLAYERAKDSLGDQEQPLLSLGTQVAGGVATLPFAPVARGATVASDIGLGALQGAGYGAAAGFGNSEGGIANRIEGAAGGAATGAVLGGGVTAAGRGVQAVRRAYANQGEAGAYGAIAQDLPGGADTLADQIAAGGSRANVANNRRTLDILGEEMQRAGGNVQQAQPAAIARIAQELNVTPQTAAAHIRRLTQVHEGSSLMLGEYPSVAASDATQRLRRPGNVNLDELGRLESTNTQGKLDYLANNGNAQSAHTVRNTLAARQETLAPALRDTFGDMAPRIATGQRTTRPATIQDTADLLQAARQLARNEYDAAYNAPVASPQRLQQLPRLFEYLANRAATSAPDVAATIRNAVNQVAVRRPDGTLGVQSLRQFQQGRTTIRGQIQALTQSGRADLANEIRPFYQLLTRTMEEMSPQWAVANRRWADMHLAQVAQDLGDAFSTKAGARSREQFAQFQHLAPEAQDIVRIHVLQKFSDQLDNLGDTHGVSKLFSSDASRALIRDLFGDQAAVDFTRAIRDQKVAEISQNMTKNSATHRRGVAQKQADAETGLVAAVENANARGVRNWLVERLTQVLTERRNRPMADILTTPMDDTANVARHLHNMRQQENMLQQFDQRPTGGAAVIAGTVGGEAGAQSEPQPAIQRRGGSVRPAGMMRLGGPKQRTAEEIAAWEKATGRRYEPGVPSDANNAPGPDSIELDELQARAEDDVKSRSVVTYGDKQIIPNNIDDAARMALNGLSNAGEVAAAFGPMGGLLDELAGAASLAVKGRGVAKGAQDAPSALDGVFDEVRASKAARAAESKASHGRNIQTQAAEQGSTGTVPIARGTRNADAQRDAEHLRSGLPEGTSPMPIKGRQGMPTRDEQFDLVDKYLSGGGRLDDIPEGPWGRNAVDDAREVIQRQWNKDNPPALPAKAASTGPEANKRAVPEIVRAWKEAKSQVAQLQARLKQLEAAPAPRRPYKMAGLDDPPRSPYSMLSPDEALSRLSDPSAVRAELRQVQEDVVKLQKIVRDAGVDLGDVAKDITPRAPPSAYRRGPE